jgi:hypothetical protein
VTVKNLIELLRASFPDLGATQAVLELSDAELQLCSQTDILEKVEEYSVSDFDSMSLELPRDCRIVKRVRFFDEDGNAIYDSRSTKLCYPFTFSISEGLIEFVLRDSPEQTEPPSNVVTAKLTYVAVPSKLSAAELSREPSIPEEFHTLLTYPVLKKHALLRGLIPATQYFENEYAKGLIEVRRYVNKRDDNARSEVDGAFF